MAIIDKPSDYFNTKLFTGNGSSGHAISGVGFKSDWTWIKNRSASNSNHRITDAVRGVTKEIYSDLTAAEYTNTDGLTAFGSDGFTVGSNADYNGNGNNIVSWNWKAGGSASSNTAGSINSSVSVNQDAGFSIVSYTGNGSAGATVAHGLNAVPYLMMLKKLNAEDSWYVYHNSLGNTKKLKLNGTDAEATTSNVWNDTSPSSSLFTLGNNSGINSSGKTMIAYCFAEKQGYSKFSSYVGNGSNDGTFCYTGFKPAFVIIKSSSAGGSGKDWFVWDNKRKPSNPVKNAVWANTNDAENNTDMVDFNSNGFKLRLSSTSMNASGDTYIYIAFAENPFVTSTGVPATAR